ncbi:MAG: polyprenyl synthetase family protein [Desulfurivibrionaceae bacterium]
MDRKELISHLEPDIQAIDQALEKECDSIASRSLREIIQYSLFNGGKRVRPVLTVTSGRLCAFASMPGELAGEENLQPPENLYRLATVFEILHAASLLHDDVLDNAENRRGRKAANKVWNNSQAILAGDHLHTVAMSLAGRLGTETVFTQISKTLQDMVEAEFLQKEISDTINLSEEAYFAVLRGKTGGLIGTACETGGRFLEVDEDQCAALRTYGDALGLSFQIIDDLLDFQGDPEITGKERGCDFREGKITLPLIHALRQANDQDREEVISLLQARPEQRLARLDQVYDIIDRNEGFSYARQGAETLIEAGCAALAVFPDCRAKQSLLALADYVLARDK